MSWVTSEYSAGFTAAMYGGERAVPTVYDQSEATEWLRGFDTYDNFRTNAKTESMIASVISHGASNSAGYAAAPRHVVDQDGAFLVNPAAAKELRALVSLHDNPDAAKDVAIAAAVYDNPDAAKDVAIAAAVYDHRTNFRVDGGSYDPFDESVMIATRSTQASLINEQAAQILNLERELKLANDTVAGLIKKSMERELSDMIEPKRLSASWESHPDVTAPVAAPFPLRALRPGRQVGTVRTGLYE